MLETLYPSHFNIKVLVQSFQPTNFFSIANLRRYKEKQKLTLARHNGKKEAYHASSFGWESLRPHMDMHHVNSLISIRRSWSWSTCKLCRLKPRNQGKPAVFTVAFTFPRRHDAKAK